MRSLKYKIWYNRPLTGDAIDVSSFGNEFERKLLLQLKDQMRLSLLTPKNMDAISQIRCTIWMDIDEINFEIFKIQN